VASLALQMLRVGEVMEVSAVEVVASMSDLDIDIRAAARPGHLVGL
jgi:hypothetical protein